VLTATFNSNGNSQISTPPQKKIDTPELINKKVGTRGLRVPNLIQIQPLEVSGQMGEI